MIDPREVPIYKTIIPKIFESRMAQRSYGTTLDIGLCACTKNAKLQPLAIKGDQVLLCCANKGCDDKIIKVEWGNQ